MAVEPPPSPWALPAAETADERGVVGVGADLEPGTLLAAYRSGLFPMPVDGGVVAWWSPDPRGILPLDGLRVSRSLRQSAARHEVSVDRAFPAVIEACADPSRPHGWINRPVIEAYTRLHELGWAHSVEVWSGDDLVGGLYGVAVGGLFAGESMFHRARDASKVALVHLAGLLRDGEPRLLDVQWTTPHLRSLGAVDIPRRAYLDRLGEALEAPLPEAFRT
jgi:leucyl/phenylalanyl-tRNA--protein transferase